MKKLFMKIIKEITWFFSENVRQAINEGKSYEEVQAIVESEVRK